MPLDSLPIEHSIADVCFPPPRVNESFSREATIPKLFP